MPIVNRIGFSDATPLKQRQYRVITNTLVNVFGGIQRRYPGSYDDFIFIDMNAGDGSGSPRIAIEAAVKANVKSHFIFIESCKCNFDELESYCVKLKREYINSSSIGSIECIHGDNRERVPEIVAKLPKKKARYGIIYHDPNGCPDTDTLSEISRQHAIQKMDIVINCNAAAIKRTRGAFGYPSLEDRLMTINKAQWIVREPLDCWQWSIIIGSNWSQFPKFKKHKFHKLESERGQEIFRRLNFTRDELKNDDGNPLQIVNETETLNQGQLLLTF